MNTWILQANPQRFRLRDALHELDGDFWPLKRYFRKIAKGDRILFWEAGPQGGIVGMGMAQSEARIQPGDERTDPYLVEPPIDADAPMMRLHVSYAQIIDPPLPRLIIKEDPLLFDMAIIRCPHNTVFPVTTEQWTRIEELLAEHETGTER